MKLIEALTLLALALAVYFYQGHRIGSLEDKLETSRQQALILEQRAEGERAAFQQALGLAATLREGDARLQAAASRLDLAIKKLGEQHVKTDPCFYTRPDPSTIDGLLSEEAAPSSP